ncbi:MAG TPA: hypothetical protein VG604_01450 [Candidatus Saccharimonadales bacterium]|nr:hypothetical protein [Candidatus Saccharimonadales bacterium]
MNELAVVKFGGSSAADPERIANIVTADPRLNRVIMLSAIGRDINDPTSQKETDRLIAYEAAARSGNQSAMREIEESFIERYRGAYHMLGTEALSDLVDRTANMFRDARPEDGYRWIGEAASGAFFSRLIGAQYIGSRLVFDDRNGEIDFKSSLYGMQYAIRQAFGSTGDQVVMDPYYGHDYSSGFKRTTGRGGSDIGGVLGAASLRESNPFETWVHINYSDQDGLLRTDPRIVTDPESIPHVTFEEGRELSHGIFERNGAFHGNAFAIAERYNVPVYIRNTFRPSEPGTRVTQNRVSNPNRPVVGISGRAGLNAIDIHDTNMDDTLGYIARVSKVASDHGLSIGEMPASRDRMRIVLNGGESETSQAVSDLAGALERLLGQTASIGVTAGETHVHVVGQDLIQGRPNSVRANVMARMFSALQAAKLEPGEISSLGSSPSVRVTFAGDQLDPAIQSLYNEFIG